MWPFAAKKITKLSCVIEIFITSLRNTKHKSNVKIIAITENIWGGDNSVLIFVKTALDHQIIRVDFGIIRNQSIDEILDNVEKAVRVVLGLDIHVNSKTSYLQIEYI